MSITYREHRLAAPLTDLVECVWFLSRETAPSTLSLEKVFPDGCIEAVFHLSRPFDSVAVDGRATAQARCLIVGTLTGPLLLSPPHTFQTLGIRFRPGCAYRFIREPMSSLTNLTVESAAVWGRDVDDLHDALAHAGTEASRVGLVDAFLRRRLTPGDGAVDRAVRRIVGTAGRTSVRALTGFVGLSPRQIERAFRARVGVSPKMLSCLLRFQNVLRQRPAESARAWADVALACGYTDQAHLIRDFRRFAGETPHHLAASADTLAAYFRTPDRLKRLFEASGF